MGFFHLGDPMTHELSVPFHTYLYDAMRETETKVSVCLVAFRSLRYDLRVFGYRFLSFRPRR